MSDRCARWRGPVVVLSLFQRGDAALRTGHGITEAAAELGVVVEHRCGSRSLSAQLRLWSALLLEVLFGAEAGRHAAHATFSPQPHRVKRPKVFAKNRIQ